MSDETFLNTIVSPQPIETITHNEPVIRVEDLIKNYVIGKEEYEAIRGITLDIYKEEFTIFYGPSGSGKSTLMNSIIGLEPPTRGKIWVAGERVDLKTEDERAEMRSKKFGIVYQQSIWIKALTVLENVALPLTIEGVPDSRAMRRAKEVLHMVGMEKLAHHKPTEASGGQQQRIGLARALVNNPHILVLDEPTGNLDTHASDDVMQLLQSLNKNLKRTIIMVTHNLIYLPFADRTVAITDGKISEIQEATSQIMNSIQGGANAA